MPITITKTQENYVIKRSSGGLVAALMPVHMAGRSSWVGYLGDVEPSSDLAETLEAQRYVPVDLPKELYASYYNGMCNGAIWPLFHYFLSHAAFKEDEWEAYREVNRLFCETLLPRLKSGDTVWVQDYQLMLLPSMLRRRRSDIRIGYFHHIPFPASEVFRVLPWRIELLEGLLGADVVGFHTLEYARHFMSSVSRLIGYESSGEEIYRGERVIKVGAFPLGVDVESLRQATLTDEHARKLAELTHVFDDRTLILGVDRLDYTKGIKERLLAFELFLRRNPEHRGRTTFLQLCVPSRTEVPWYVELKNEIERLVGRINGEFSTPTHVPVQYLFQSVDLAGLTALYKRADVCLVTPLRDGLNLVCKEYVLTRDDLNGVLVLSEYAGAAEEMGEALIVNPYDVSATAASLEAALEMSSEETSERMGLLRARVRDFDNRSWAGTFLEILDESVERNLAHPSRELDEGEFQALRAKMSAARQILVCMDYDATLALSLRRPDIFAPSHKTLELLARLCGLQKVQVALMTHRSRDFCMRYFSGLPLWLIAESGAFVHDPQRRAWNADVNGEALENHRTEVLSTLERCVRRVPGSRIEEYETSIVWNYSQARSTFAHGLALETAHTLNQMLSQSVLHCVVGRKSIEVRSSNVSRATGLEIVCNALRIDERDLIVTFGDNRTGDDLYRLRNEQQIMVTVGSLPSVGSHLRLRAYPELETVLARVLTLPELTSAGGPAERAGGEAAQGAGSSQRSSDADHASSQRAG